MQLDENLAVKCNFGICNELLQMNEKCSYLDALILDYIYFFANCELKECRIKNEDIAAKFDLSLRTIKTITNRLENLGLILIIQTRRNGIKRITAKARELYKKHEFSKYTKYKGITHLYFLEGFAGLGHSPLVNMVLYSLRNMLLKTCFDGANDFDNQYKIYYFGCLQSSLISTFSAFFTVSKDTIKRAIQTLINVNLLTLNKDNRLLYGGLDLLKERKDAELRTICQLQILLTA